MINFCHNFPMCTVPHGANYYGVIFKMLNTKEAKIKFESTYTVNAPSKSRVHKPKHFLPMLDTHSKMSERERERERERDLCISNNPKTHKM